MPRLDLLGDLAAGEGVRARVDDGDRRLHEADLHALRARARRGAARARLRRRAQLRRLRGDAAALGRGARAAVPDRLRRAGRRHDVERAPRRGDRRAATCICADVGGTSTDISLVVDGQPFVNNTFELEHDLVINALSTEISSVGAGGGSIVSISPSGDVRVGPDERGLRPRAGLLRARRHAADDDRRLPADGHPRPRRTSPAARCRLDADAGAAAFEALETPPQLRASASPTPSASPSTTSPRRSPNVADPPRRRPARLHARRLRRGRADAAAGGARADARARASSSRRTPACSRRSGLLSTDLVYYDSRSAYVDARARRPAPQIAAVFEEMERALRERSGAAAEAGAVRRSFDGRLLRPELGDAVRRGARRGRSTPRRCRMIERFHDAYERRYGNRFAYVPVQGVSYRVAARRPVREGRVHAATRARTPGPPLRRRSARVELRHLDDEPLAGRRVQRASAARRRRRRGPRDDPRGALDDVRAARGQVADRRRASARS